MHAVAIAVTIMGGLGLLFGAVLAIAYRFLRVPEDPQVGLVESMLPGSNCGACGEPGCRSFAEKVVAGVHSPSRCTASSAQTVGAIADALGVEAGEEVRRIARLHCAGGRDKAAQIAEYEGYESCRAAALVGGGGKGCSWGCLGLGDCRKACMFDAITMGFDDLPRVEPDRCTACGDCVTACPRGLFEILPVTHNLVVQCSAPLAGDSARALCVVACDACGRCAQDAPPGLITMEGHLPVVNYAAGGPASEEAILRCPTGAIQWVMRDQFPEQRRTAGQVLDA